MRRSKSLLDRRRSFVMNYINSNQAKQMKVVVLELSEKLFITERTIYKIINEGLSLTNES